MRNLLFAVCSFLAMLSSCGQVAYAQSSSSSSVISLGTFYAPDADLEQLDVAAIYAASGNINLAAFSLTDKAVVAALAERAKAGITVRIYLDRGELRAECRGDATCARIALHDLIGVPNVEIKVKHSLLLMHLKSYAVGVKDAKGFPVFLVRDGSANFSEAGERRQDNSASFTLDPQAAGVFGLKFREMWARPDNLTVTQALASGP